MEGAPAYIYDETGAHLPIGDCGEDADHAAGSLDGLDAVELAMLAEQEAAETALDEPMVGEAAAVPATPAPAAPAARVACAAGASAFPVGAGACEAVAAGDGLAAAVVEGPEVHVGFAAGGGFASAVAAPPRPTPPVSGATPAAGSLEAEARADLEREGDNGLRISALADSEAQLRAAGHLRLADDCRAALRRELKKSARPTRLAVLLRAQTLQTRRRISAERVEEDKADRKLAELKLRQQVAGEKRLAGAHVSKAYAAIAKAEEEKCKKARLDLKGSQAAEKLRAEELRRNFPGILAKELDRWTHPGSSHAADEKASRRKALMDHASALKDKRPWRRLAAAPVFWNMQDKAGLRCVSIKDRFGKWVGGQPVYATEALAWQVWGRRVPDSPPELQLGRFVNSVMPGFADIVGPRFPVGELLRSSDYNMDFAFLTAAWHYFSLVPESLYPGGLRKWPRD